MEEVNSYPCYLFFLAVDDDRPNGFEPIELQRVAGNSQLLL